MPVAPSQNPAIPEDFAKVACPGAILSNAWPEARNREGGTLDAIEQTLTHWPFFGAIQTIDVPYPAERRAIARVMAERKLPHSYTLTRLLADRRLNLSSLDAADRQRAVDLVRSCFDDALETGTGIIAFIPGARPAEAGRRAEALAALADSVEQLATAAAAYPEIELLIEPLDYEAHKRNALGTTAEAVQICQRLANKQLQLQLCLDTSHLILNQEEPVAAVDAARQFIHEFHFCNPVLDRTSPLYGDQHPPFGPPGVVDVDQVAGIMAGLWRSGYLSTNNRPRVFAEVMKPAHLGPGAIIAHCHQVLTSGWAGARRLLSS